MLVQNARDLCDALKLSAEPGQGNLATMLLGVRAYRVQLNLMSPFTCAVDGTSRGPCCETAYYIATPNHLSGSGLRSVNVCAKHAALMAYRAGRARQTDGKLARLMMNDALFERGDNKQQERT